MLNLDGNHIKENSKGISYHVKIHGLKQCVNYRKLWSRDYNAALNIGYAFVRLNKDGKRPLYLTNLKQMGENITCCKGTDGSNSSSILES